MKRFMPFILEGVSEHDKVGSLAVRNHFRRHRSDDLVPRHPHADAQLPVVEHGADGPGTARCRLSSSSLRRLSENREAAIRKLAEEFGGRLHGYFFTGGGEFDGVTIVELPDTTSA